MEAARQIRYGREDCKSRVYGLFPYLDWDENSNCSMRKATDDVVGCWGHVMPALRIPDGFSYTVEGDEDDESVDYVLEAGQVYSYRTIMNFYYRFRDNEEARTDANEPFFEFVERGFGIEYIDKSELTGDGVEEKDLDLVPSYVNIVTCAWLVEQYRKVKYRCEVSKGLDDEKSYNCCICERYKRMGGDKMLAKLTEFVEEADAKAIEYLSYGVMEESRINLNVKLDSGTHDFGVLTAYLNPWVGGEHHYPGELYTYTDEDGNTNTWVCTVENTDFFDCETERFVFPDGVNKYNTWGASGDDLVPHTTTKCFEKVTDRYSSRKLSSGEKFGTKWDYDRTGEAVPTQIGDLDGDDVVQTESKLTSLKDYINEYGEQEQPADGEDWLFFYRKGHIVDYTMNTDENGNIVKEDTGLFQAFGNLITDITYDTTDQTITFTYKMGVRLRPTGESTTEDDDGNKITTYTEFIVEDLDTVHGVTYQETYRYELGGELAGLIESGKFEIYVTDDGNRKRAMGENEIRMFTYSKYAFNTSDNIVFAEKRIVNSIVTIPYIPTRFETAMDAEEDLLYAPTFKTDYLNGITYEPIITNEVWIDRGINAMWEKHVKLGEVKTLQDMENYANGSVFVMQET